MRQQDLVPTGFGNRELSLLWLASVSWLFFRSSYLLDTFGPSANTVVSGVCFSSCRRERPVESGLEAAWTRWPSVDSPALSNCLTFPVTKSEREKQGQTQQHERDAHLPSPAATSGLWGQWRAWPPQTLHMAPHFFMNPAEGVIFKFDSNFEKYANFVIGY